jgi:hypothetical protein
MVVRGNQTGAITKILYGYGYGVFVYSPGVYSNGRTSSLPWTHSGSCSWCKVSPNVSLFKALNFSSCSKEIHTLVSKPQAHSVAHNTDSSIYSSRLLVVSAQCITWM